VDSFGGVRLLWQDGNKFAQDVTIPDDLLAHVAPLGWEHIALTGDYVWADGNAISDFRPLRAVPAAFLAQAA
jgi:hypothetical protein